MNTMNSCVYIYIYIRVFSLDRDKLMKLDLVSF